jgi:MoaA/NifB/PqqE/SkfB family radical SAM enzyme
MTTLNHKATIFVVSGNLSSKNAKDCLKSLKATTPSDIVCEVIVVEAGIRPDFNHAQEINKVLHTFKGDYLVLLDDDVILERGWLNGLIGCAESNKGAGIIGAVLKNKEGHIVHTGGDVTDTFFGIELRDPISKPVERKYVCSAVMLITREAAEKIGPFDEEFRKYGQDADYCLRAWEAGFKVLVSPDAEAVHLVGQTVNLRPDMKELFEKDKKRFYSKWRHSAVYNRFEVIDLTRRGVTYPTFACNAKCCFCYYYKEENREQRSLDEMKREMDEFRNRYHLSYVDITGGEPTVYKHVRELVAYCNSIGLLPTIITNGQKSEIYADLIDAGLEDILISIHGYREDCDRALGRAGAFDCINKTIEIIKGKKFGFRTNTTLLSFNYKNLPKLAGELIAMGPRISNFISFNPHEGTDWSKESEINFQPKYSDVAPYLTETINRLMAAGIWVNVRYFPLCMLKGYEQHLCNFHQWQWDPYEWDYFQGYKLDKKEMKKIGRSAERENMYGIFPEERMKLWITKHRACGKNLFFEQCRQCANKAICDGVYPQYAARFGSGEFLPLEGELIRDPLHYRKKNQAWRMMKQRPASDSTAN